MNPERLVEIQEEFASLFQELIIHIDSMKMPNILKTCAKGEITSVATVVVMMLDRFRRHV